MSVRRLCGSDMPLLTELETSVLGRRFYKHAAPNGAVTHVPKGRPKCGAVVQPSLRDLSLGRASPALKRWAILRCAFGTGPPVTSNPVIV